jgi:hypothetical protein
MPSRSQMRASDADRERVAERLRRATAEGRLSAEELEERLATALRARTYGQLDALVADLPSDAPARPRGAAPLGLPRPALALAVAVAVPVALAVVAFVLFLVTGFVIAWLPWLAICWWTFGGGARGRRHSVYRRCHHRRCAHLQRPRGYAVYGRRTPRAGSW